MTSPMLSFVLLGLLRGRSWYCKVCLEHLVCNLGLCRSLCVPRAALVCNLQPSVWSVQWLRAPLPLSRE